MILENIIPILIVSILMAYLYSASKKAPKRNKDNDIILQLPKLYLWVGIIVLIAGMGLFIFASFFANGTDKTLASISGIIAIITGLILFSKAYIAHIKITDTGIVETTMFGKVNEMKWKEIKDFSFGKVSSELKIISSDNTIKAHMHLVGFQDLVSILEQKTGKSRLDKGIPDGVKK